MKRLFPPFCVLLLSLLLFSSIASAYKPGDTVHIVYNPNVSVGTKPKFIRYTITDSDGKVTYEEDHSLTYLKEIGWGGSAFAWYDYYDFRVPAFAKPGTWHIQGRLFSEALWIIEVPDLFPLEQDFTVEKTNFIDNLFAPFYFTYDGGFMTGRISGCLPFHPLLLIIILGVVIIGILLVKIVINVIVQKKN